MTKFFTAINCILKTSYRYYNISTSELKIFKKSPWKVLFFGSDDFSLYSLKALFNEYKKKGSIFNSLEVITSSQLNPVWKFSMEHKLVIRSWPPDLKKAEFDIGLVVSFGHLIPEHIIDQFPLGMLNVHASLLPRWRGASPIIYALANGDRETGITIMRVRPRKFDIGEILHQKKIEISPKMEMPELHKKLGMLGANCLVETLRKFDEYFASGRPQSEEGASYAPKITPNFAEIQWQEKTATNVYNLNRALKSVLFLKTTWNSVPVKLIDVEIWGGSKVSRSPGYVEYDKNSKLLIIECANESWISVKKVGIQGKKIMTAGDFYNGFISKVGKNTIACFR